MIRIVFTADNHLNKYYAKMTADQLARRRQRIREAWAQTVDFAIERQAHFYLHGGDLFDTPSPRTSELVWVARHFQRLQDAGVAVYAIGGNHDVPKMRTEGATPHRIYDEVRVARVFTRTTEVEWAVHEVDGTVIAIGGLAPDPRLGREDDPLEGVAINPPQADVVLLLMHYAVEGTLYYEANESLLSKAAISDLRGIDYLLVGHVHQRHHLEIGGVTVCFPGPTERMSFGEMEAPTGFFFMKFDGQRPVRASIRHRKVDPQPMERLEVRTTDLPAEDPTGYVFERVRAASRPDQLLQCCLKGPLSREVYHRLNTFDIWRLGNELNFYFDLDYREVWVKGEADPGMGFSAERVSPRQEIEKVAAALAAEAEDTEEQALIEAAKELVLERYGSVL
jgi:exonuclease SbcD